MADDAPWTGPVVVPDDLRELQADIDAYHREQRIAARRRRWHWLTGSRAWQRLAMPVAVLAGSMGLAGVVFAVLTLGQPKPGPVPVVQALASPALPPGQVHGLLPDVAVTSHHVAPGTPATTSVRALRPALVALVPSPCGCSALLAGLAGQADEVGLPLVVVAPTARDAEIDALPGRLHRGRAVPVFDAGGTLAHVYRARGVTAVGVAADGTVGFVQRAVTADDHLEGALQGTVRPAAATTP